MPTSRSPLRDPKLFGNEAGEDEDPEVLDSYFVTKPEFDRFFSADARLGFVRSRKGVGKSALLRQAHYKRQKSHPDEILIYLTESDLEAVQKVDARSASSLLHGWQQRICSRINLELGARLSLSLDDNSLTLIEAAEVAGFRSRNIVASLLDRVKIKAGGIDVSRQRAPTGDAQALLARAAKGAARVWLFVDDVDATFIDTEQERLTTSTFFSACRNLTNSVTGLHIRASVRSDVWSVLANFDESLDKCEQYMLDLQWSVEESGRIIENKILTYFRHRFPRDSGYQNLVPVTNRERIFSLVFRTPFPWGRMKLPPHVPIHTLSAGRPRWATQLCKLAAKDTATKDAAKIGVGNVTRAYSKSNIYH